MAKLQITVNNQELYDTIMSISKTQRGQFITLALAEFIQTEDGKKLLRSFAKHQPDTESIIKDVKTSTQKSTESNGSVMGDFGE